MNSLLERLALDKLLDPKSVAIVGATPDPGKLGAYPLRLLTSLGFQGQVYPINPKYDELAGKKCYPTITSLPEAADMALIALPAKFSVDAVEECGKKGIKAVTIISSGFAEMGAEGAALQRRLCEVAEQYGIAVMGPNCTGYVNWPSRLAATFISVFEEKGLKEGEVSFITQSGALSALIVRAAKEQGLGLRYMITTGNEATLSLTDYIKYLLENDSKSKIFFTYVENIKDGEQFKDCALQAARAGKPILLLKPGRTEAGTKAAASHTGSLTGADEIYAAVFEKYGIIRADSVEEWLDVAEFMQAGRLPQGNRVLIITVSGAVAALIADKCVEMGLELAELSQETKAKLREVLPSYASLANPLDVTANIRANPRIFTEPLRIALQDPNVDAVIAFMGVPRTGEQQVADGVKEVAAQAKKPILMSWLPLPLEGPRAALSECGVPVYAEPSRAVKTLAMVYKYVQARKRLLQFEAESGEVSVQVKGKREKIQQSLEKIRKEGRLILTESETKYLLEEWGMPVPRGKVAATDSQARIIAGSIGFPVVLKISSPDITHKTDAGLVKLGLKSEDEVAAVFNEMLAKARGLSENCQGILIEEMVSGSRHEMLVGAKVDSRFGPMLTFGLGGIFVEVLKDVVIWPAPLSSSEARELLSRIKGARLLQGYRQQPKADVEKLLDFLVQFSIFLNTFREEIAEIDINPLFVLPEGQGVLAGDALLVLRPR